VGRRHLNGAACAAALALAAVPSAGAASLPWRLLADGAAPGSSVLETRAYVALSRPATRPFASFLPAPAVKTLAGVDFARRALIAVSGEFGCRDSLIRVDSVTQNGRTLAVALVEHLPPPGVATCMAIFPTYRLLTLARSNLRPLPTHATVTLARA
jgi:hypothetical protein